MATDPTTSHSTHIGSSIPAGVDSELIAEVRETLTMVPFVDFRALEQGGGLAYSFQQLNVTVGLTPINSGTSEAGAQALTTLATTSATATAASKSAHVLQSWISQFGSAVNWKMEIPKILGRAAADIMDVDAAALLGGAQNSVGSTGVDQSIADLRAAGVTLRRIAKGAANGALYMLHPQQVDDVDAQLTSGTGAGLSAVMSRSDLVNWYGSEPGSGFLDAYRGTLFGRPVFTSNNVPDANGTADHAGALFVPKAAFGGVYAWLPTMRMSSQDVNLKLADSYQVSCCYGFVEKKDEMLVTIIGDHV